MYSVCCDVYSQCEKFEFFNIERWWKKEEWQTKHKQTNKRSRNINIAFSFALISSFLFIRSFDLFVFACFLIKTIFHTFLYLKFCFFCLFQFVWLSLKRNRVHKKLVSNSFFYHLWISSIFLRIKIIFSRLKIECMCLTFFSSSQFKRGQKCVTFYMCMYKMLAAFCCAPLI